MKAPDGLQAAGRKLWGAVAAAFPPGWELDEREIEVLTMACRQADDNAALARALKRDGLVVSGASAQPRVNPAATEVRQGRLTVGQLLGQLHYPMKTNNRVPKPASERGGPPASAGIERSGMARRKAITTRPVKCATCTVYLPGQSSRLFLIPSFIASTNLSMPLG